MPGTGTATWNWRSRMRERHRLAGAQKKGEIRGSHPFLNITRNRDDDSGITTCIQPADTSAES
jgi:hypothetical protein